MLKTSHVNLAFITVLVRTVPLGEVVNLYSHTDEHFIGGFYIYEAYIINGFRG